MTTSNLNIYNPDILSTLANLSSDEVFTPPEIVNQMLDLLPKEIWHDKNAKFLDPSSKSGVFLREIAKRLNLGLAEQFPILEERLEHIFKNQIYGIALTELTSLLTRRSLYCSKYPNGIYSIIKFDSVDANINYDRIEHDWVLGKCSMCGASKTSFNRDKSLETYAYKFIHTHKPEEIFKMKFDVIIGNPPYQLKDGGGMGTSAIPLYHLFVKQAKKLNPRFLSMIIPSRWFAGGKGLDEFRSEMLNDKRITHLVDYFNEKEVFPGIDLSGGVCYFLWERDRQDDCTIENVKDNSRTILKRPLLEPGNETFIRFNDAISIVRKVESLKEQKLLNLVSSRKPFGLDSQVTLLETPETDSVYCFAYPKNGYINRKQITQNVEWIDKYKVYIAKAYGERGDFPYLILGKPFIGLPNTCCSETYLVFGPFNNEVEAKNLISYIQTKFFRFLVLQRKNTQNAAKGVYSFVPYQDFSKPWSDIELYEKYSLDENEINLIESMIRPMNLGEDNVQ